MDQIDLLENYLYYIRIPEAIFKKKRDYYLLEIHNCLKYLKPNYSI